jgi:hypothetical protein
MRAPKYGVLIQGDTMLDRIRAHPIWYRLKPIAVIAMAAVYMETLAACNRPGTTGGYWERACTGPESMLLDLRGVWVEDFNTAYFVGDESTVLRTAYRDDLCTVLPVGSFPGPSTRLNGVTSIDGRLWVVVGQFGANGMIAWAGQPVSVDDPWTVEEQGTLIGYNAVWGSSSCDVFVVGEGAMSFGPNGKHWDCAVWESLEIDFGLSRVSGGAGTSSHDVWVVLEQPTANLWHYDGSTWEDLTETWMNKVLYDISARPNGEVFAVGAEGTVYRFDGTAWEDLSIPDVTADLYGVWAGRSGNDVFAVGQAGTVYQYVDGEWTPGRFAEEITDDLHAVHGFRSSGRGFQVVRYAVGDNGTVLVKAQ